MSKPAEANGLPTRRVLGLILCGLLVIGIAGLYLYQSSRLSVGSGPAGPTVARMAFAETWSSRPVLLVGMGDSVTAGFGARRGYSYFDRVTKNPSDEFEDVAGACLSSVYPALSVTNLAVSGSVSEHLLHQQLPLLPKSGPEVLGLVLITTGGNDLIHNYGKTPPKEHAMYGATWDQVQPWIRNFEIRLNRILDELTDKFPGGHHVFIANIYDPTDTKGDIERAGLAPWPGGLRILNAYNAIIERAAHSRTNVHLVDMYSEFLGHGIHSSQPWSKYYHREDPHYWYFTNLEDPNERGYDAIRRLFLNKITAVCTNLP